MKVKWFSEGVVPLPAKGQGRPNTGETMKNMLNHTGWPAGEQFCPVPPLLQ